jgi:hypothetical protein
MALSQDEQRVLAEIERRLAADDPGLATCLTSFRRPGPATVLRSRRARIIGSLFTVLLVAMVSLIVYAMIPFRAHGAPHPAPAASSAKVPTTGIRAQSAQAATASGSGSASANAKAAISTNASNRSAAPLADVSASTGHAQGAKGKTPGQMAPAVPGP